MRRGRLRTEREHVSFHASRGRRERLGASENGPHARPRPDLREPRPRRCAGREGARAARERGRASRHRRVRVGHAGRPLGLRFSDRRRGRLRPGGGRHRFGRRRRLRHLVRREDVHDRPYEGGAGRSPRTSRRRPLPHRARGSRLGGRPSPLDRGAGRRAARRRALGRRKGIWRSGGAFAGRGARCRGGRGSPQGQPACEGAPASRGRHARLGEPLPRAPGRGPDLRRHGRPGLSDRGRRNPRDDPLRVARPR